MTPFADGELLGDLAEQFRQHLVECAACREDLHAAMMLAGAASQLRERRARTRLRAAIGAAVLSLLLTAAWLLLRRLGWPS